MPVNRSLRPVRLAALAVALAVPLVVGMAAPGFASGESASAVLTSPTSGSAQTFTWTYTFDQNGGNRLSNVAIGFCSAEILADVVSASPDAVVFTSGDVTGGHTGFGPGIKFGVTATSGTLAVTFAHTHPIDPSGLRVQSHSGGGQTGDATTVTAGPGPCPEVTTTTTGGNGTTTTTGGNGTTTTTTTGAPAPGVGPTTTTTGGGTTVLGVTLNRTGDPAVVDGGSLARTGTGHLMFLLILALSLLAAGFGLMSTFRRRVGSASSSS